MCAAVLLIIVMTMVFPLPQVPLIVPIGGALISYVIAPIVGTRGLHAGLANYYRRSRHDHRRRLDNHGLRSRYNHWCWSDYDWNRQPQSNGDTESSRMRGQGQDKACTTQEHCQTKHPWECAYAFHCSILLCLRLTISFGTTCVLLLLMWLTIISLLSTYLPS
jgi:hypothetical protein